VGLEDLNYHMWGKNVYPSSNRQPYGVPWNGEEPVSSRNCSVDQNVLEFQAVRLMVEIMKRIQPYYLIL
jgi:hypothetical protein